MEGEDLESFNAISWNDRGCYIQVVVAENGVANYMFREEFQHKHDTARYTGFKATLKGWEACEVANLIRNTLRDDVGIQDIWRKLQEEKKC
jgi:hypothetical protein